MEQINATTYKQSGLGDVKPLIVIGGNEKDRFIPNCNMSFGFGHDEEFFINLNRKDKIVTSQSASI